MITADEVLRDLEAVVAEFGDGYVYPNELRDGHGACVYADRQGVPRCIVGHVLARRGLLEHLAGSPNGERVNGSFPDIALQLAQKLGNDFMEGTAVNMLWAAQKLQDERETWGLALIAAKEKFSGQ